MMIGAREQYRGLGDSTVEHRPADDAVVVTDGGVATETAMQDVDETLITGPHLELRSRVARRTTDARTVAASRSDAGLRRDKVFHLMTVLRLSIGKITTVQSLKITHRRRRRSLPPILGGDLQDERSHRYVLTRSRGRRRAIPRICPVPHRVGTVAPIRRPRENPKNHGGCRRAAR